MISQTLRNKSSNTEKATIGGRTRSIDMIAVMKVIIAVAVAIAQKNPDADTRRRKEEMNWRSQCKLAMEKTHEMKMG